jgi:DNA repair and recombination protein RAD54B
MLIRNIDQLRKLKFDLLICDEAHRLKNTEIKTSTAVCSIDTRRRIALTGTPIQNDLGEFFAIVEYCNPGVLGTPAVFRRIYEDPIVKSKQPDATKEERELGATRGSELTRY